MAEKKNVRGKGFIIKNIGDLSRQHTLTDTVQVPFSLGNPPPIIRGGDKIAVPFMGSEHGRVIAPPTLVPDPTAWYPFEDQFASTVDVMGNFPVLGGSGNGFFTTGVVGSAVDADAGSRMSVTPADEYSWYDSTSYTVEFWFYPRSDGGENAGRIFTTETAAAGGAGVLFYVGLDSGTHVNMNANWIVWSGTPVICATPINNPLNAWTHIVCVWSTSDNLFKIYHDAVLQTLVTAQAGVGTPPDDTGFVWHVLNTASFNKSADGLIDELRFYRNVELTQAQISQRYNDTVPS